MFLWGFKTYLWLLAVSLVCSINWQDILSEKYYIIVICCKNIYGKKAKTRQGRPELAVGVAGALQVHGQEVLALHKDDVDHGVPGPAAELLGRELQARLGRGRGLPAIERNGSDLSVCVLCVECQRWENRPPIRCNRRCPKLHRGAL